MRHVDLVKNEWLAGFQHVVAQAHVEAGEVHVEAGDEEWRDVLLRPIHQPGAIEVIYAEKTPEEFLEALSAAIHGTYLFATEPHEQTGCPYGHGLVVPIEPRQPQLA